MKKGCMILAVLAVLLLGSASAVFAAEVGVTIDCKLDEARN